MLNSTTYLELFDLLKAKGYLIDFIGTSDSVKFFSNVDEEIFSIYNGVGLRINKDFSLIELKGKDSLDFLHRITTNSILHLKQNETIKTIFTNEKGKIIGLADVINLEDKVWLKTDLIYKDKIIAWINRYIITDDVIVQDISNQYSSIDIYGTQKNSFIEWIVSNESINLTPNSFQQVIINYNNIYLLISNFELNHSNCFSLLFQKNLFTDTLNYILDNKGPYDLSLIGDIAFESYRIEQGILKSKNELNDNFNPHELNLTELIDFKKGCYIGQEVLARLETYDKVQKKITGVSLSDEVQLNDLKEIINQNNDIVGFLTSSTFSIKLKKFIGLAVIKKKFLNDNETLLLNLDDDKKISIFLHELPFINFNR